MKQELVVVVEDIEQALSCIPISQTGANSQESVILDCGEYE